MHKFYKKRKGATMIEYVLIVGLLTIAAISVLTTLGVNITGLFTKAGNAMPQ